MSSFVLKIIAMLSMLCDHLGSGIIGRYTVLNLIGRMSFPIFAFQISQSYIHTSNLKKFLIRLLLFACISQLPFMLFLSTFSDLFLLNIFFTMLLGVIAMIAYDKIPNKFIGILVVLLICGLGQIVHVDYYAFGVGAIFLFYFFTKLSMQENITKNKKVFYRVCMCLLFIILVILKYLEYFIEYPLLIDKFAKLAIFTCLPLVFILQYNGKEGPKMKYLFYVFYPLHLLIIWLIHTL